MRRTKEEKRLHDLNVTSLSLHYSLKHNQCVLHCNTILIVDSIIGVAAAINKISPKGSINNSDYPLYCTLRTQIVPLQARQGVEVVNSIITNAKSWIWRIMNSFIADFAVKSYFHTGRN